MNGILIDANNVTIDLMGYILRGDSGTLTGIVTSGGFESVRIRNGIIQGWEEDGITLLGGALRSSILLEHLQVIGNGRLGVFLGGNAIVRSCTSSDNESDGFRLGGNSIIENCHALRNKGPGISGGDMCTASNCVARSNQSEGIRASLGAIIHSCTAIQNHFSGIAISTGIVKSCCSISNEENGIQCTFSASIHDCYSSLNVEHGISVGSESHVRACSSDQNGNGITGAGINAQGNDIRIEDNNCCKNDFGIRVTTAGNFIARNTCSGNGTNWSIAANNKCLVVSGVNAGAINGDSGGTSPGSTNPNANYTY